MIIEHRINTIDKLINVNKNHGIEVDVRWSDKNNNVIITHDYTNEYVFLKDFLKFYNHKFLILNIKESQCEDKCIEVMKNFINIDYYFLDSQIPDIVRLYRKGYENFIIRLSVFEEHIRLYKHFKYIWLDTFGYANNLNLLDFYEFKENEIILTSPELHGERNINEYVDKIKNKVKHICTKYPNIWKDILND